MIKIDPKATVIHVNRGRIDSNRKHGKTDPVLAVRKVKGRLTFYGNEVVVFDKNGEEAARFVYEPDGILKCGAKVVLIAPYGAKVYNDPLLTKTVDSG